MQMAKLSEPVIADEFAMNSIVVGYSVHTRKADRSIPILNLRFTTVRVNGKTPGAHSVGKSLPWSSFEELQHTVDATQVLIVWTTQPQTECMFSCSQECQFSATRSTSWFCPRFRSNSLADGGHATKLNVEFRFPRNSQTFAEVAPANKFVRISSNDTSQFLNTVKTITTYSLDEHTKYVENFHKHK